MSFPTREQVLAAIQEHAPERLRQVLAGNLMPAIGIVARPSEDARLQVGASKIGGAPDVPAYFEWPTWNGKPLGFVAQFDLGGSRALRCGARVAGVGHAELLLRD